MISVEDHNLHHRRPGNKHMPYLAPTLTPPASIQTTLAPSWASVLNWRLPIISIGVALLEKVRKGGSLPQLHPLTFVQLSPAHKDQGDRERAG